MELKDQVCTLEQAKMLFELMDNMPESLLSWMRWDAFREDMYNLIGDWGLANKLKVYFKMDKYKVTRKTTTND